jgi:hypothetical protein
MISSEVKRSRMNDVAGICVPQKVVVISSARLASSVRRGVSALIGAIP